MCEFAAYLHFQDFAVMLLGELNCHNMSSMLPRDRRARHSWGDHRPASFGDVMHHS
jgi:hypothetical protein